MESLADRINARKSKESGDDIKVDGVSWASLLESLEGARPSLAAQRRLVARLSDDGQSPAPSQVADLLATRALSSEGESELCRLLASCEASEKCWAALVAANPSEGALVAAAARRPASAKLLAAVLAAPKGERELRQAMYGLPIDDAIHLFRVLLRTFLETVSPMVVESSPSPASVEALLSSLLEAQWAALVEEAELLGELKTALSEVTEAVAAATAQVSLGGRLAALAAESGPSGGDYDVLLGAL